MKVIVSVQTKRSSSRGLVHYIAHSKIDAGKELPVREVFNEHSDQISVEKVNDFLKNGISNKRPSNDDLHHLVISLKSEDYERLGTDEKERQKSLKEITRHTMKQFRDELDAEKLSWAAGIHRNTDNPHVHIAIQKEYFDKNLEKKSLNKIPASLLPHHEKVGGGKTFKPGILIEAASEKLDEIISAKRQQISKQNSHSKTEQKQFADNSLVHTQSPVGKKNSSDSKPNATRTREREILAEAILAKYYLEKTQENLESLVHEGDKRRFKIFDKISKQNRKISLSDLQRRAEKSANQIIKKQNVTDAGKKDELRNKLVESELEKNTVGIKQIKTILHNLVVKETSELRTRETDYKKLKPLAEKIRAGYKSENKKLPVPNLTPDELEMLQARSLEEKDIRAANYFEKVRKELSFERGYPTRSEDEIVKLKARKMITDLKIQWQEKQLQDFNDHKRAFPVEIDGRKLTLAAIDSLIEKSKQDDKKIVGKVSKIFGKIGLIEQKETLAKLEVTKSAILENLREKTDRMAGDLTGEKSILQTLDEFYKNDTNPEKENLPAKFNAVELAEVESFAFDLKLADVYRENWEQQKQLVEISGDKSKNKNDSITESKQNFIAGRSIAREILTEIEVARCKEEFADFKKNKDFQKFEITNKKGEAKFVSLTEVRFDSRGSLFDQTLEYFLENRQTRATRNALEKIVKERSVELKENLKSAQSLLKIASENANDYKTKSFFGSVKYLETPVFTPKELMTIELRINQTENKSEAAKLQNILDSADQSKAKNLSAILVEFTPENERSTMPKQSLPGEKMQSIEEQKPAKIQQTSQDKTVSSDIHNKCGEKSVEIKINQHEEKSR